MSNPNLNEKGNLNSLQLFLMGGALFSMHFGAASMIWPMEWGKAAGKDVLIVFAGAFITALLLVIMSYVALSRTNGNFPEAARKALGAKGGMVFSLVTATTLAVYGVPRMSAAVWDAFIQATGYNIPSKIPLLAFTAIFYVVTYFFLISPGKSMDRISKILFPVLIVVVVLIIGKGILTPISGLGEPSYSGNAFAYGFTQGYSTLEVLCGLVFGVVILNNLKEKGVSSEHMHKNIIRVGIVGIGMLTCSHLGNMIIGATSGPEMAKLTYISLYTAVAFRLLGNIGGIAFVIAALFAALTTAVGVTTTVAEFYENVTDGKISYKTGAVIALIFSTVMGCMGLTALLSYISPLLNAVYPATIVLVLHYSLMPDCLDSRKLNMCRWGMIVAVVFGIADFIKDYCNMGIFGDGGAAFVELYSRLPLCKAGMAWVPFTIIAYIVGYFVYKTEVLPDESEEKNETL